MTDQSTRDPWTRPTRTLERANIDRPEPDPSTQDSVASDLAAAERSAEDGPVYHSAAHDAATPERTVAEPAVQGAADDHRVDANAAEHPVVGSVPADHADLDHAESEHVVGVASMPGAEPGPNPQSAQEHRGVAAAASPGGPVEHLDKAGVVAGGHAPIVPASVGGRAAPEVSGPGELLPGDVPVEPVALFDGAATQGFRGRWQQLQLRFIDDPHTVATQAGALADEVVTALRDAVDQQRTTLEDWQSDHGADAHSGDTERLRVAVRRYRDFVDRLLAM